MSASARRVQLLRQHMSSPRHNLQAYLVPSADAHQSEYIAACDARRSFISGFTGSAGYAVVTMEKAALWTDGRYFLQASKQLDASCWQLMRQGEPETPDQEAWLTSTLPQNARIGVDATTMSVDQAKTMKEAFKQAGMSLVGVDENLVDLVWQAETDPKSRRPSRPCEPVFVLDQKYSGVSHVDKLTNLRTWMAEFSSKQKKKTTTNPAGFLVTALDEVAWLLNLRGADIEFNPVFFSYCLVTPSKCVLYIDAKKLDAKVETHLKQASVDIRPYESIFDDFKKDAYQLKLGSEQNGLTLKLMVSSSCNWAIEEAIGEVESRVEVVKSPVQKAKAIKNETELEGFRQCHLRDAAALCNYFGWLENELLVNKNTSISEVDGADKAEEFRSKQRDFIGLSFDTISGSGSNGAIIHYKPERPTCAMIDASKVYLCDSGAQYRDGTTDVTRTYHFTTPTAFEKEAFTRVLKGHIAIDRAIFPQGTTGYLLDAFARQSLWNVGLDYRHGTGHGVGSFLNVHEGPQGIGFRIQFNDTALEAGMTVTDEPGYYHDGHFGIRIENILVVKKVETPYRFGDKQSLGFEHVTFVPLGQNLMDMNLLTGDEKAWINRYHEECLKKVGPLLDPTSLGYKWLVKETQPI